MDPDGVIGARRDGEILVKRQAVYETARARNPERWSGDTRNWTPVKEVTLNPETTAYQQTG